MIDAAPTAVTPTATITREVPIRGMDCAVCEPGCEAMYIEVMPSRLLRVGVM